ncbi:ATP-binding cassette domain-containing protein [Bacillus shivajii]|uniref:ATP-binding cassette domain-containing protein n=1 Tax=Bacillus shivajii TaxID=1983719 RepID=UPI001CF9AC1E|nr:ATP-binding cassette domain-containing protein [Bacillus shivajii]UCZ51902.1 ATP-binding cassette domain-containing protein [Bacillus shivajii]
MFAVEVNNVLKRFASGADLNVIFDKVNLQVEEGDFIVISGGSQSGKTTLLKMIAAMTPPNKGSVKVFGEDLLNIKHRTEWRLENIGFITDEGCLIPFLTTKQNLLLGTPSDDSTYKRTEAEAERILSDLGFTEEKMNETLEGLDDKEQVLATIARILMTKPKLILADEPTKQLSGIEGQEVLTNLFRFAKKNGSTVIIASNDECMMELTDQVYSLENNRLTDVEKNRAIQ